MNLLPQLLLAGLTALAAPVPKRGPEVFLVQESSRPRIARAMANLGMALHGRLSRRPITPEEIDRIVSILDDTASAIEKS